MVILHGDTFTSNLTCLQTIPSNRLNIVDQNEAETFTHVFELVFGPNMPIYDPVQDSVAYACT